MADLLGGDGDDAALIGERDGSTTVAAAEAISPEMLAAAPEAAGLAGGVTVLNDLAATGARPVALLDAVVAPDRATLEAILRGLGRACELARTPVVGGHATVAPGAAPALSTFALGRTTAPLLASAARPGDPICLAACLEGEAHVAGDVAVFSHLRGPRRDRLADDLALVAAAAERGDVWAASDVSMPGIAGSLVQMMEAAGRLGAALDLDAVPVPPGLAMERWLTLFPSYAFLLVGEPAPLGARFGAEGLVCVEVGRVESGGVVRLTAAGETAPVWDLSQDPLTGLSSR